MYLQLHVLNEARDLHLSVLCVWEQRRLYRDCAQTLACLSRDCLLMQYVPKSHTLAHIWTRFKQFDWLKVLLFNKF